MKLSVIIPCYNTAQYLSECIESVIAQSLVEIEIICINDGSTDESLSIIESYQKKDSRIIIINQVNKGLSAARNVGLKIAKGDYIYFLDSDDLISAPMILESCVNIMQEHLLDVLICNLEIFYDKPELVEKFPRYQKKTLIKHEYDNIYLGIDVIEILRKNHDWDPAVGLKMYNASFLKKNNLLFSEGQIHEDEIFSLKSLLFAKRTKVLKSSIYKRRIRKNSIMTSPISAKRVEGYLCNFIEALNFFELLKKSNFPLTKIIFVVGGAVDNNKRNAIRLFLNLDNLEQKKFINGLSELYRYYFDVFMRNEIELINKGNSEKILPKT